MKNQRFALTACIFAASLCLAPGARAWGQSGHSIIAEIAQRRLEPSALRKVKELLGGEVSLASVASWADGVRLIRPNTYNWHFVDIPYDATSYDPARDCKGTTKGDCVIAAIERFRKELGDPSRPSAERTEALMFLVHFMGDIHQPLHCAERNHDQGGNAVRVSFFGRPMNLHAVWDYGIIDRRTYDWGEYVRHLERDWFPDHDIAAFGNGDPAEWAWATHQLAVNVAYALPDDLNLTDEYYAKSLPAVDQQLALAGVRLAKLLNDTLRD
jgi:hypothetical protein